MRNVQGNRVEIIQKLAGLFMPAFKDFILNDDRIGADIFCLSKTGCNIATVKFKSQCKTYTS